MRKSYHRRPAPIAQPLYRVNERIRVPQVKLIDESGQMVGVVSIEKALQMAHDVEMDLVEVSPKDNPPVVKILDYGQFKYRKEKEQKQQKTKQKASETKGVRLSFRIGQHDLDIRLNQAKKFLEDKDKVKIEMMLKGRERQHGDQAREIINQFIKNLGDGIGIEQPLTKQGGKLIVIIAPKL
ncbi:MAG: translation initiation factor IF-3 [Patescibacteria group bacterium]